MDYLFYCRDAEGAQALRDEHMAAHLKHIESVLEHLVLAGPCPGSEPGDPTQGSLLIFRAASEAEAVALFQADPYFAAGVWKTWEVLPFKGVAGELLGGKTW
ncbi:MAG: YciI family protein [Pseudomonadota bacterium]